MKNLKFVLNLKRWKRPSNWGLLFSESFANKLKNIALLLLGFPIAVFLLYAVIFKADANPPLQKIATADLWIQPIGAQSFERDDLATLLSKAPDFSQASWKPISLPNSIPMEALPNFSANAPKSIAWFRLRLPNLPINAKPTHGNLGIYGTRIMGGPWAFWIDDQLLQTNVPSWRIQWNTPVRVTVAKSTEITPYSFVYLAVAHPTAMGYGVGSLYFGSMEAVELHAKSRTFIQTGIASITTALGIALALMALQLALGRRKEPVYSLLCLSAVAWVISGLQYTHDFTNSTKLSLWYGWAMDASISWAVMLGLLFICAIEKIQATHLKLLVVLHTVVLTVVTMPVWEWGTYGLVLQHSLNVAVILYCCLYLSANAYRKKTFQAGLLTLTKWVELGFGIHDLFSLTTYSAPDEIHIFQINTIITFFVFAYLTNKHYLATLRSNELHELELQAQLREQEQIILEQQQVIQSREIERRLTEQRNSHQLDLHDRVGSLLITAKHQAHQKALTQQEVLNLIDDLSYEIRDLAQPRVQDVPITAGDVLSDLHDRYAKRIAQTGIELDWQVSARLLQHTVSPEVSNHLKAMLAEIIANILKHANAKHIQVCADVVDGRASIAITDDGSGFDESTVQKGRGLEGIRYRASLIATQANVQSRPGYGCEWRIMI